jgi:UDP-glucose 4-epimerase
MLAGEVPTIYGDGEQSRDFTFIQDVVRGNLLASEAPAELVSGKVFNVATGHSIALNQAVEVLREVTGYRGEVRYAQSREGDVKHSKADISRATRALGYQAQIQFRVGMERTVAWYREQAAVQAETRLQ